MSKYQKLVELNNRSEMTAETIWELECDLLFEMTRSILPAHRVKDLKKRAPDELLYEDRWARELAKLIVKALQRHRWHVVRLPPGCTMADSGEAMKNVHGTGWMKK